MSAISRVLGIFVKVVYDALAGVFPEPTSISFFALSIIITTIILKLLVLPLTFSQMKNQKKMAKLQPELENLKKKYKNDPQTLAMKQQKLYKDANVNVLGGCLPMIIQLVVLIAFYRVFMFPQKFAFIEPGFFESINKNFLYISNLEKIDTTMILPAISAISTFLVSFITSKNPASQGAGADQAKSMMNTMMIVMPVMIFMMGRRFQSGLVLYWTVSNLFAIVQQLITNKVVKDEVEDKQ